MPIKAKYSKPAIEKDIQFGRTIIDWDEQTLLFQLSDEKSYNHKLTKQQWNYLINGLWALMNQIPNISGIEIPDFNPEL